MDRSSTDDESATMPSEVYIVLHERQMSVDARYSNYAQPYCQQMNSEIISVHYEYENAVSHASKYVREFWAMDDEDEEWLEQLDWQGEDGTMKRRNKLCRKCIVFMFWLCRSIDFIVRTRRFVPSYG